MNDFIPYGRQNISDGDIDAVVQVLKSDWLTTGPNVDEFEHSLSQHSQAKYCIAVCNATAALHIAYMALEIGKGDAVWTSPNTFLATANAAIMCGASVDFVDICSKTYNISVESLEKKLIEAKKTGTLPKLVVPVHFGGQSCDMQKIAKLSQIYGFKIVEDASHAIGGDYQGEPVGNCQYSDITVFSFHPVKIMTTAEGGALLTNDKGLNDKLRLLRTHGMTRDSQLMENESEGGWYYEMVSMGYNYRITDIQCALGSSQLKRLNGFIDERHAIADRYSKLITDSKITLPFQNNDVRSSFHLYPILVESYSRKQIFDYLRNNSIGVNVLYIPLHIQPYYKKLGFELGNYPNAEKYYSQTIALPMYSGLSQPQQIYVTDKLQKAVAKYGQ